ncbi:MAG TPA: phosphoglycolate phosphatase [Thermoplasmata archaeon]|nr:phosphoglycolate phosphatase [Thermoplasmata archaeon]
MPDTPSLRALVTDIDGTLTDGRRRLLPEALDRIRSLEHRGVPVVLATGNVLPVALALHRFVGLTGPIVAENGGILYERVDGEDQVRRLADRAVALRALRALVRAGLPARRLFTDRWRETEVALEPNLPVDRARRVLADHDVDVVPTGYAVHLIQKGRGKLYALDRALRRYRLTPADCMVAGDGENDVPILAVAGWAVSFRDADPKARAVADFVARRTNAFGFVEALKRARFVAFSASR